MWRTQEQGRSWRFRDLLSKIWSENSSPAPLPSSFSLQQVSLPSAASQPRTPGWHRGPDCYVCTAQLKQPFHSETNPPDLIHLFPGPMHTSSLLKKHFITVSQKVDLQSRAQSFYLLNGKHSILPALIQNWVLYISTISHFVKHIKFNILQVFKLIPVYKHPLKAILFEQIEWTRSCSLYNILPSNRILYLYQQSNINMNIILIDLLLTWIF